MSYYYYRSHVEELTDLSRACFCVCKPTRLDSVLFACHPPPGTIWLVWAYISHGDRRTVLRGQTETKLHIDTQTLLPHSIGQSRSYGQAQMQGVEK